VPFVAHLQPSLAAGEPATTTEGVLVRDSVLESLLVMNEGIVVKQRKF
jgi:hypothetical protein